MRIYGHRGAKGTYPENTMAGFQYAHSLGIDGIEFDIGVSRDKHLMISHDRFINSDLARDANGKRLLGSPLLQSLNYADIRAIDVGRAAKNSQTSRNFPEQLPIDGAEMPSLSEVLAYFKEHADANFKLLCEIKTNPLHADETPPLEELAGLFLAQLQCHNALKMVDVRSFHWQMIRLLETMEPDLERSYCSVELNEENNIAPVDGRASPWTDGLDARDFAGSVPQMLAAIGGKTWSPHRSNLSVEAVEEANSLGIAIIPWTVNAVDELRRMQRLGVAGVISDYPAMIQSRLHS